ncbi:MAG: glycan-binding surface protein, partial [Chitinophagaceae bacterium]
VIAILFLANACKKENLSGPVVTGLRAISPAPNDSTLTQVVPGQIVVIKGYNLNGLQQVLFDGYQASVNTALNTNGTIVITVPSGILFTSLSSDVANTIKVITTHGETVYKFAVAPPPPVITSISNEFAHGGDTIIITGSYLYTVQSVTFPGDNNVTSGFVSDSTGATLQIIVPNGITPGEADSLAVVTEGGTGKAAFNNTYGMIADFEWGSPTFGWQYWGGIMGSDASKFPDGWGNYIEINPSGAINGGDQGWYANNRAVMIASSPWEGVNISDPPGNYALKFQMYVLIPWTAGSLETVIAGNFSYMATYAPWQQTTNGTFITNGWITVSIPLSNFTDSNGNPAATVSTLTGGKPGNTVQIMLYNNGTTAIQSFDAAFDNVRIVKIK